jgi:hypothetical protein
VRDWLYEPPATLSDKKVLTNHDDRDVIKERCNGRTFFLIIRGIFYYMKVIRLEVYQGKVNFQYIARAIEHQGRYYYRVGKAIIEISQIEYNHVIINPNLYYFSSALKLHYLIQRSLTKK